jgi:ABC-type glycerol-3-phosphate transport system substrate-binding protein
MSEGENTIRLLGRGHPLAIKEVRLLQAGSLQESGARAETEVGEKVGGWYRLYEAEQIGSKSDASIQLQTADSVKVTPPTEGRIRFNVIGGEQFRRSGEWIEWEFEVPHEGDYEIGFKFMQNFINNFYSCRSILIDGQALQEELGNQKFPYGTGWQAKKLEDGEGRPIRFRLSQGKHTLKMIATAYPVAPIYEGIEGVMKRIADLEFAVRKVTGNYEKALSGGNADANRDWELEAYVPDLQSRLKTMGTELLDLAERAKEQSVGGASDIELALRSAARELADLGRRPAQIPNELGRFATMQKNLSQWLYRMMDQPLLLDSFWVAEPAAKLPRLLPNGLETFGYAIKSFFRTFRIDYDFRRDDPGAIEVWVNRNRDYVALIGRLAAESFTPKTGIAVNINIVPDPQMFVLGNAAGIQPDVALGVDQAMPVDFASRGALLDLSQFADYSEAAASFHPGALRAFHYKHGDYALPENQGFHMLAYRTDILEGLGLKPPDTWEEMYRMLPNLQQNGYDFYLNPKDFQTFIYQNGGELYEPDGMSSGLESEEAYTGFRQWTEMFTLYQLPREVPSFFSHFRQGTIPIGIIDFNAYLQLQFAAPEIAGKWKIAAIPGTRQPDGSIARWSGGGLQGAIIFSKTDKKKEAWEFLKWWTSEETQERFGSEVEALFGPEYRWNTANRLAFRKLPWPAEHLRAIEEQMRWFKEAPQVPGGYFTARQVDFAWNSVVINRRNIRESLEKAVLDINREMARKQTEFRLRDRLGGIMEPLDVPAVTKPGRIEGGPRHEIE